MSTRLNLINNNNNSIKGLSAFYLNKKYFTDTNIDILKEEYIVNYELFKEYPEQIKLMRNNLIYLTSGQILASVFGMLYIIIRRSYLYVIINILSIIFALVGLYGSLTMSGLYLMIHCFFTTSLTGGFTIFQIIDFFLVKDTTHGEEKRLGDSLLLIIFSLPYLFDCFTGLFNFKFLYDVSKFLEERKERIRNNDHSIFNTFNLEQMPEYNDIIKHINEEDNCVICCEKEKSAVMSPCGHMLSCIDCATKLLKSKFFGNPTCPVCRKEIKEVIRFYPV